MKEMPETCTCEYIQDVILSYRVIKGLNNEVHGINTLVHITLHSVTKWPMTCSTALIPWLTLELLTDFEEMIPGCHKLFPEGQVGPDGLGEEDDDNGELEHFAHRGDELLGVLRHHLIHAAHTVLKQHHTDPCMSQLRYHTAASIKQDWKVCRPHSLCFIYHVLLHSFLTVKNNIRKKKNKKNKKKTLTGWLLKQFCILGHLVFISVMTMINTTVMSVW